MSSTFLIGTIGLIVAIGLGVAAALLLAVLVPPTLTHRRLCQTHFKLGPSHSAAEDREIRLPAELSARVLINSPSPLFPVSRQTAGIHKTDAKGNEQISRALSDCLSGCNPFLTATSQGS